MIHNVKYYNSPISNKLMDQSILDKKNKQNINKINSIINQYEGKLDKRVNQVIHEMINYTKKINDQPLLPVLRDKKIQSQKNVEKTGYKHRNKSSSHHSQLSFLTDTSLQAEVTQLRNTFKQIEETKTILEPGRQVGKHSIIKPKFVKRKVDVLPREVRLNPFHERNAIKAYQLQKGVLSLIEKGKIGKDVNIITAFEKGRPILHTQKAIFHQGEERFAELQADRSMILQDLALKDKNPTQKSMQLKQRVYEENWALTMPKEDYFSLKDNSSTHQGQLGQIKSKPLELSFKEQIYIKIMHYKVQCDSNYKEVINKHRDYKGEIVNILHEIGKLMRIYSIQIGYADSSKIMNYVCRLGKLKKQQLLHCIAGNNTNLHFTSLKNVKGEDQKFQLSLDKVASCLKFNMQRKAFVKYLKKKLIANRIYGWAVSCWTVKKHRQLIKQQRKQMEQDYLILQQQFRQTYSSIQSQKHYQIHLINQQLQKEEYKERLNIQITKIFNIKNVNKHIIYILPYSLDQDTINYYYKIMELQEIPNYKERVWFLDVDPSHHFTHHLSLSAKLYYNSQALRKLKKKIKDAPAYFVVSYPLLLNIQLATYLSIPILSGNLHTTLHLQKLTHLEQFSSQALNKLIIDNSKSINLTTLSNQINQFCQANKRVHKYVVKINQKHKSTGIALLTAPFNSLPEMYSNTALITPGTVDTFYKSLIHNGGVIEKYQENISFVSVVLEMETNGTIKIVGTFQKISSGFVNVAYIFPQRKIQHKLLVNRSTQIAHQLTSYSHFGTAQLTFIIDDSHHIFLQKIQCYSSHLGSALHYYTFLSDGKLADNGEYMAKIIDTFDRDGKEEEVVTLQPRSFCYIPFLLHFGLSDRQTNSFFQLCRMGGVSFDLQNKYGATFILLGSMKSSMGLITTAKDKKGAVKLMLKSLQFILKQNSHNMSSQTLQQKQTRMKQRQNVINVKERLENL